jgi:site-specific DNA recombinase
MVNNSNRYAMYLRKSRKDLELEEQGEGETLSRHFKMLEDLCKRLKIVVADEDIYKEVVSGETITDRPEMQKLLNKVNIGFYKGVLVVEIERLARGDSIDQGTVLRSFKLSDTKIITPLKIYNFKDEIDEEYIEFGLFMSRREYKVITKRLQRGRLLSAKEGKFVGSKAPYGYERIKLKGQKGYSLKINQTQANIVKTIYDMFVNKNYKPVDICRYLNSLSILSPSASVWSVSGIREILRNPIYKGYILFNERVTTKYIDNNTLQKNRVTNKGDLKELVYIKGLHEPIISEELFNKAELLRKSRDVSPLNKNCELQNPLAGLLKCKLCGHSLVRYTMRGVKRVYCKTDKCKNVSNPIDEIEEKVLFFLENWIKNKEIYFNDKQPDNLEEKNKLLHLKEIELKKAKNRKEHIYELFEEQIYDKTTFFDRTQKIENIIKVLENEILNTKKEIKKIKEIRDEKENYIPTVKKVLQRYKTINNAKEKNELLKTVIDKIYYLKTEQGNKWHKANFEIWILPKLPNDSDTF